MVGPDGPRAQFPARLSRRLSVAQALILIAVLIAGGLALFSAAHLYRINTLITQEYDHALTVEVVQATFHKMLAAAEESQMAGGARRPGRLRELDGSLDRQMYAVIARQRDTGAPTDKEREDALIGELRRVVAEVRTLTTSFVPSATASPLQPQDLERLEVLAEQGEQVATKLVGVHQEGVRLLLQLSQRRLRLIIALYVGLLALGLLSVGLAAVVGNRWITAPLQRLAKAAALLAEGRFEARVAVQSRDEIGQLSDSFNVMADRLQARERELQAAQGELQRKLHEMEILNEIGSRMLRLSGQSGRDVILRAIVEGGRGLLSVDATALCLATTDPENLVVHSTSGPDEAFRLRQGVARLPGARGARDQHTIADCPVIRPEFARSHLAMPLQYGGESRGVLCVAANEKRVFGDHEVELLTALSAQAAIAIEHFRLDSEVQRLAVIEERGRIAREMHDGLAQAVSLLHLRIRQAQAKFSPEQFSPVGNALEEIATISGDMYEEIRRSISGLRTPASQGSGFVAALGFFLEDFSALAGFPVTLAAGEAETFRLAPAWESQIVRIVQEALNNVRKHAQVDRARVCVERGENWLRVSVQDDGRGFDPASFTAPDGVHFGLQGMRERAEGIGGKLEIVAAPGRGTSVIVLLPLEKIS